MDRAGLHYTPLLYTSNAKIKVFFKKNFAWRGRSIDFSLWGNIIVQPHSTQITLFSVLWKPGSSLNSNHELFLCFSEKDEHQLEEAKRLKSEMLAALKARREALELKLKDKNELLKELCIKEGELTGTSAWPNKNLKNSRPKKLVKLNRPRLDTFFWQILTSFNIYRRLYGYVLWDKGPKINCFYYNQLILGP